ncbi:uncharacterized protein LTR77_001746 [Saxophila tyrrhenica]|uniref:Antifreeze protein n=1 Tax=Saxophila tyrrhenica TaxID=1690608 RepID=A0AAV9PQU8_9PEZI|nr:hypothetical protein LTR77_001746 [Saxophila tyrrhenica]
MAGATTTAQVADAATATLTMMDLAAGVEDKAETIAPDAEVVTMEDKADTVGGGTTIMTAQGIVVGATMMVPAAEETVKAVKAAEAK